MPLRLYSIDLTKGSLFLGRDCVLQGKEVMSIRKSAEARGMTTVAAGPAILLSILLAAGIAGLTAIASARLGAIYPLSPVWRHL